mmetsp:Transcript_107297/g.308695  ORF Transcript_107297/g.308695 Transcript_107297/m.308695 type:complete len:285 (-) Transcript_107297:129-983(-)
MGSQCSCSESCVGADGVEVTYVDDAPPLLMDEHAPCLGLHGPPPTVPEIPRLRLPPPTEDSTGDEAAKQAGGGTAVARQAGEAIGADSVTQVPSPVTTAAMQDDGSDAKACDTRRTWDASEAAEEPSELSEQDSLDQPVALPHLLRSSSATAKFAAAASSRRCCEKGRLSESAVLEPIHFRVFVDRPSVEEYLGLDVKSLSETQLDVVSVDPEGLCAQTGKFQPGDIIHSVNGVQGSQRMIAECIEAANLVFEVSRLAMRGSTAGTQRVCRPNIPPLKLPSQVG